MPFVRSSTNDSSSGWYLLSGPVVLVDTPPDVPDISLINTGSSLHDVGFNGKFHVPNLSMLVTEQVIVNHIPYYYIKCFSIKTDQHMLTSLNPYPAKLFVLHLSRYRDPQPEVIENYSKRPNIYKS